MKKVLILLSLLLAVSLAACRKADDTPSDTATSSEAETTVEETATEEEVTTPEEITEPETAATEETSEEESSEEETSAAPEETTEPETVPMIEFTPDAIVASPLVVDAYRDALNQALAGASLPYTLTSDGADAGFDAVVVSTMEPKAYSVFVTDNAILVRAGHYLSLEAAFKEILTGKGLDGVSFAGEYSGSVPLTMEERVLVWNDEFDGDALDPAKWALKAKMNVSDVRNSTDEKNVTVTDGNLLLRTWKEEEGSDYLYSTNTSVTTDGTLSFKYGYLEMSAIVPYERGAWPSFWLLGSDLHKVSDYRAEVDVLEVFGSINKGYSQLHKALLEPYWINYMSDLYPEDDRSFKLSVAQVKKIKTEYHRYGFGWTPTEMYFTLDGEVFFTHDITEAGNFGEGDMSCFHDPMYFIFNNFLYSPAYPGPSAFNKTTDFPIEYHIDWVRLYQTPGEGVLHYDGYAE